MGPLGVPVVGETLNGYRTTGKLGPGRMGEVQFASDTELGCDVALLQSI